MSTNLSVFRSLGVEVELSSEIEEELLVGDEGLKPDGREVSKRREERSKEERCGVNEQWAR